MHDTATCGYVAFVIGGDGTNNVAGAGLGNLRIVRESGLIDDRSAARGLADIGVAAAGLGDVGLVASTDLLNLSGEVARIADTLRIF